MTQKLTLKELMKRAPGKKFTIHTVREIKKEERRA